MNLKRVNATTYAADLPRARVEIGDADSEHFLPVAKIDSFEGETRFKVGYADRPYSALGLDPEAEEVDRITLTEGVKSDPWVPDLWYEVDQVVEYEQTLYRIVQSHTSLAHYPPPIVPALYTPYTPPGVIAEWEQKEGAHDAYDIGDMVLFEGKVWRSLYYPNTWSPTEYPDGWEVTDGRVDVDCYFIEEYGEQKVDAFEFEIVLRDKSLTNIVTMQVEMDGLTAHYQPQLTQEEIDEGAYRPEDVVGSYAVYHATCGQMHKAEDAEKYQTGKAFHIYRPKVVDANGDWVWGELSLEGETLSITIDQAWLDSAVYPVRVDPTFGYVDENGDGIVGSSTVGTLSSRIRGSLYTDDYALFDDAEIESISAYCTPASSTLMRYAIYDSSRNFIASTNEISGPLSEGWHKGYFEAPVSLVAGDYIIALWYNSLPGLKMDSITGYPGILWNYVHTYVSEDSWPDPLATGTSHASVHSLYASEKPAPVPVLTATQVGSDIKLTWVYE